MKLSLRITAFLFQGSSIQKTFAKMTLVHRTLVQKTLVLGACIALCSWTFASPAYGQNGRIGFDVSGSIDWIQGELNAEVSFDLAQAGIRLPTGRFMGEEALNDAYPRLLLPSLLSLKVDSSSTIRDLVDRREISLQELDAICKEAGKIPPSLSSNLTRMIGRYSILMEKISAMFILQSRAIEPRRPLISALTADYTGIIVIAERELPVHGRNSRALVEPCLFPKIWDTNMNLIYERNMINPPRGKEGALMVRYAVPESIFRPTPSGLDGDLAALLGPNPLRILARGTFGIFPTDLIIDSEDAMKILSTENNRRLLREGRVALVLNEEILKKSVFNERNQ